MLHIIQNDPEVPPGAIPEYVTVPYILHRPFSGEALPAVADVSAMIVLGGAMGVNDDHRFPFLGELRTLVRQLAAAELPYFGICLGGQLLASALGARVHSGRWEEMGVSTVLLTPAGRDDVLFSGIEEAFQTFQWHHDSFELPQGAALLATSPACPHQAFRVGRRAWGVQFHPEVNESIIMDWCAWEMKAPEQMVAAFRAQKTAYRETLRVLISNFLTEAGLLPRCRP